MKLSGIVWRLFLVLVVFLVGLFFLGSLETASAIKPGCEAYDLNGDGEIDVSDTQPVSFLDGTKKGDPNYNSKYDVNKDGEINKDDVGLIQGCLSFGAFGAGEEGKPTPCSIDGQEGIETALGCIPTDVSGFVGRLLSIFLGVAGGIAFLMMIFGAFKIIGSSGDPDALQEGRSIITAAITGLLLILFSVFILNLIGIKILQLPIPGIGFIPQSSVAYAQFAGVPDPTKYGGKDLGQVVSDFLPFVFSLAAIVTFLYLLYGGFKYLTASGDPKAVDSARKVITSAVTGLIIIFLSFTIITVLGRVLGLPFVFISPVYAQGVDIGESFGIPSDLRELSGFGGFLSQKVLPLVFGLAGIIFFFYLLFGGIKFLTASGDPKAVDSAKRSLTTAFIGLLIIFLSFWIMVVIGNLIGFQVF